MNFSETLSSLAHRLKDSLDQVILVGLGLLVFGIIFYLLTPQPQYTLRLDPGNPAIISRYKEQAEARLLATEQADVQENVNALQVEEATSKEPPKPPTREKKKPKVIPIVNINTAGPAELDELPGVGPKMALRILQYRKGVGKFQAIEELTGVKGIGAKTFAKMKPYLKL